MGFTLLHDVFEQECGTCELPMEPNIRVCTCITRMKQEDLWPHKSIFLSTHTFPYTLPKLKEGITICMINRALVSASFKDFSKEKLSGNLISVDVISLLLRKIWKYDKDVISGHNSSFVFANRNTVLVHESAIPSSPPLLIDVAPHRKNENTSLHKSVLILRSRYFYHHTGVALVLFVLCKASVFQSIKLLWLLHIPSTLARDANVFLPARQGRFLEILATRRLWKNRQRIESVVLIPWFGLKIVLDDLAVIFIFRSVPAILISRDQEVFDLLHHGRLVV
ncbi:unnamed protein product [Microthlaspi erraticum]|uniref:Uncharacterized protein n=1 Tax=Microthlaspi erraticum TaxID=1685480 RepID=A0A6D2HLZ8_9BRAS|nr:unnamed protein product [Microthlaspi erraticum]